MQLLTRLFLITLMLVGALPLAAQQVPPEPEDGLQLAELVTLPDLLERAVLATQAGDFSQAILDYSLFLLFNPTFGQAWHGRGISHAQNGDFFRALQDYARALDFSALPENQANVYYDRANVYLRQNRMDAALGDLDSAISVWPEDVDSRRLRARIMALENQNEAALTDYETLLELMPGDVDILLERAYLHMQRGAGAAAARDYDAAVALAPEDPLVLSERAAFRANSGQIAASASQISMQPSGSTPGTAVSICSVPRCYNTSATGRRPRQLICSGCSSSSASCLKAPTSSPLAAKPRSPCSLAAPTVSPSTGWPATRCGPARSASSPNRWTRCWCSQMRRAPRLSPMTTAPAPWVPALWTMCCLRMAFTASCWGTRAATPWAICASRCRWTERGRLSPPRRPRPESHPAFPAAAGNAGQPAGADLPPGRIRR